MKTVGLEFPEQQEAPAAPKKTQKEKKPKAEQGDVECTQITATTPESTAEA